MRLALAAILAILSASTLAATPYLVVGVHDGDSLTCLDGDRRQVKVRLSAIDAPELGQPHGRAARDRLGELVMRKEVELEGDQRDRYGRLVCRVVVDGLDVNATMVAEGLAWHYTRYSDDEGLTNAERQARAAGRGLWRDPRPVPPWDWRATEREKPALR